MVGRVCRRIAIAILAIVPQSASATFAGATGIFAYDEFVESCAGCAEKAIFVSDSGQITFPALGEAHVQPAFSPQGTTIAYAALNSSSAPGGYAIRLITPTGASVGEVVNAATVASAIVASGGTVSGATVKLSAPAWSPDAQKIAFGVEVAGSSRWAAGGIFVINIDGTDLQRLVPNGSSSVQTVFSPEWSPLGGVIAFRCKDGSQDDLCTYRYPGGPVRNLQIGPLPGLGYPSPGSVLRRPRWTPDGQRLVFSVSSDYPEVISWSCPGEVGSGPVRRFEIFSVRADGSGMKELTRSPLVVQCDEALHPLGRGPYQTFELDNPTPSPDGKSILAVGVRNYTSGSEWGLYQLDSQGRGGVRKLPTWVHRGFSSLDWQPLPEKLTVFIDDGHEHPLAGLRVKLCTASCTPSAVVGTSPFNRGGAYIFANVAPGDYVIRAELVDEAGGENPAFGIVHPNLTDTDMAWIERTIHVPPATSSVHVLHFDNSAPPPTSNVPAIHRDRLDDLAAIYWRVSQFVEWVRGNLGPDTGRGVVFNTFFTADVGSGPWDPDLSAYFSLSNSPSAAVLMGTSDSAYEARDSISDENPENGEWHEFTHHLFASFVDSSVCPGTNHGGYANSDTCDSLWEGFAAFLPTFAAQQIEGVVGAEYGGFYDLEGGGLKAWSFTESTGNRIAREDLATGSLLWDLTDAGVDSVLTEVIGDDNLHHTTLHTDAVTLTLGQLWARLTTSYPGAKNVRWLWSVLSENSPITVDLDGNGSPDVSPIDQVFLMHGFFPVDAEQSAPGHAYHYDVAGAQPQFPRNDEVGLSDHNQYDVGGALVASFVPRLGTPLVPGGALQLHVQDATGTPLSGVTVDLGIPYLGQPLPNKLSHQLDSGDGALVPLELRPYYDYLLPDGAPLPPCDPESDVDVNVTVTARLNGYTSGNSPSFDNCTYHQAIASASGPAALSFTLTFPEDSTRPVSTLFENASVPPVGNGTSGFWYFELDCSDPVVGDFASGCYRREYRLDSGPWTSFHGSLLFEEPGQHTLEYRSVDAAGNEEPLRTRCFAVDVDSDCDDDGLTDSAEIGLGTDFNDPDSDDDALLDGAEVSNGTNPRDADSDDDLLLDGDEVSRGTNPLSADSDGDGLGDHTEVSIGTNPNDADTDADGLSDSDEFTVGTDPRDADSDDDGLVDGQEVALGTNPRSSDSDGDALNDGDEIARGTDPLDPDSDDDSLLDGDEVARGIDPLDPDSDDDTLYDADEIALDANPLTSDSDGDGVSDVTDNCLLNANSGQQDRDNDGWGNVCDRDDSYASWQLVGVTGDGATTPEALFAIDTANASASFLMSLGNGSAAEAIGFNPADGLLYHTSGVGGDRVWESIDVGSATIVTSGPFSTGNGALTYHPATGKLIVASHFLQLLSTTSAGVATQVGTLPEALKGLAFVGRSLYGAASHSDQLYELRPHGAVISNVGVTLGGNPVEGMNGLATDPSTGMLWAILRQEGARHLGTVDPTTGVASSVGSLPDNFAGISFVPEPPSTAALAAGVIAVGLCALHRRRRAAISA